MTLTEFLTARLDEDEDAARRCAEVFPSPWEIADRGWMARIYAATIPDTREDADPGDLIVPCVIEIEPTRHHEGWLGDQVDHIARHDPARVLADVAAKREVLATLAGQLDPDAMAGDWSERGMMETAMSDWAEWFLRALARPHADHPDYDPAWA